jgi:hypothetical protein
LYMTVALEENPSLRDNEDIVDVIKTAYDKVSAEVHHLKSTKADLEAEAGSDDSTTPVVPESRPDVLCPEEAAKRKKREAKKRKERNATTCSPLTATPVVTRTKKRFVTLTDLPQSDDEACSDQSPSAPLPNSTIPPHDQGHFLGASEDSSGGGGSSTRESRCLRREAAKGKAAKDNSAALGGAAHDDDDGEPNGEEVEAEGGQEDEVAPMTKRQRTRLEMANGATSDAVAGDESEGSSSEDESEEGEEDEGRCEEVETEGEEDESEGSSSEDESEEGEEVEAEGEEEGRGEEVEA